MSTSTLTIKGQVTIPKTIRNLLGLQSGDEVEFDMEDHTVVIHKKMKILPFQKWQGYLGKLQTQKVMDELR